MSLIKPLQEPSTEKKPFNRKYKTRITNFIWKFCRLIGKFFGSVALWELAGYWQPAFRAKFANWYQIVDALADFFNKFWSMF